MLKIAYVVNGVHCYGVSTTFRWLSNYHYDPLQRSYGSLYDSLKGSYHSL
jgi:hypothetical protein